MRGFLGTRGDLLSDVLILALIVILPALVKGVSLARERRFIPHKMVMMSIFTFLVLYVVIYEANLTFLGGVNFLREKIRISERTYFSLLIFHVTLSALSLILGGIAINKGEAAFRTGQLSSVSFTSSHRKIVWVEVLLLSASVMTGLIIYYLTFIY